MTAASSNTEPEPNAPSEVPMTIADVPGLGYLPKSIWDALPKKEQLKLIHRLFASAEMAQAKRLRVVAPEDDVDELDEGRIPLHTFPAPSLSWNRTLHYLGHL